MVNKLEPSIAVLSRLIEDLYKKDEEKCSTINRLREENREHRSRIAHLEGVYDDLQKHPGKRESYSFCILLTTAFKDLYAKLSVFMLCMAAGEPEVTQPDSPDESD